MTARMWWLHLSCIQLSGLECETCENPCSLPRPDGCSHECLLPCHPGNCPPCKQMMKTRYALHSTHSHPCIDIMSLWCNTWILADVDVTVEFLCFTFRAMNGPTLILTEMRSVPALVPVPNLYVVIYIDAIMLLGTDTLATHSCNTPCDDIVAN